MKRQITGLALALVALATNAAAETYHVSPSGDDGATGLAGDPWSTLQHAADRVEAGDTVIVAPGSYQGFYLEASGTEEAPITFRAEEGVDITSDNPTTPDGINVESSAFVVVEGFTVHDRSRAGLRCATSSHVTFRNNIAHDNARWGILTGFCDDLVIEDNQCSASADEHGIYVSNSADRPTIRRNFIYDNNANGIHMNGDASLGGDGMIEDALVERNVIFGNGAAGGSGINCDGCLRATIRNNLVYDTHASGISLYAIDAAGGSQNNLIVNNTIVVADDGRWAVNIQDGSTNNRVFNNILLSAHDYRGAIAISADSLEGFESDHNVTSDAFSTDGGDGAISLAEWQSATGQDAASLVGDSASSFADAVMGNYHLDPLSLAIDAGSSLEAPSEDLDGNPRPLGAGIDIGAYEFCEGSDCAPPTTGEGGSTPGGGSGSGGAAARAPVEAPTGCAVGSSSSPGGAALVLLALGLRRRRRS